MLVARGQEGLEEDAVDSDQTRTRRCAVTPSGRVKLPRRLTARLGVQPTETGFLAEFTAFK